MCPNNQVSEKPGLTQIGKFKASATTLAVVGSRYLPRSKVLQPATIKRNYNEIIT